MGGLITNPGALQEGRRTTTERRKRKRTSSMNRSKKGNEVE